MFLIPSVSLGLNRYLFATAGATCVTAGRAAAIAVALAAMELGEDRLDPVAESRPAAGVVTAAVAAAFVAARSRATAVTATLIAAVATTITAAVRGGHLLLDYMGDHLANLDGFLNRNFAADGAGGLVAHALRYAHRVGFRLAFRNAASLANRHLAGFANPTLLADRNLNAFRLAFPFADRNLNAFRDAFVAAYLLRARHANFDLLANRDRFADGFAVRLLLAHRHAAAAGRVARIADRTEAIAEARPEVHFRRNLFRVTDGAGSHFRDLLGFPTGLVHGYRLHDGNALRDVTGFHRLDGNAFRNIASFHDGFRNRLAHGAGFHHGFRDHPIHGHVSRPRFLDHFGLGRGVRFLFRFVLPHGADFVDVGRNVFRNLDRRGTATGSGSRCPAAATAVARCRGTRVTTAIEQTSQLAAEGGSRGRRQTEQPCGRGGQQTRFSKPNHDHYSITGTAPARTPPRKSNTAYRRVAVSAYAKDARYAGGREMNRIAQTRKIRGSSAIARTVTSTATVWIAHFSTTAGVVTSKNREFLPMW